MAHVGGELAHKPLDRALLAALVEQTAEGAPIADIGCGPGPVASSLVGHGAHAVGIDLSPRMISVGRDHHPEVEFRQGDFLSLPAKDAEFAAIVAVYSIIHLQPDELRPAFDELCRVVRPGGLLLVSFHVGDEVRHSAESWGHDVDLDFRFFEPNVLIELLEASGFVLEARLERTNYPEEIETRRGYLLVRRRHGITAPARGG